MELFLRAFSFFILGLLLMWVVFVVFILSFKGKISKKHQSFDNFEDRYSDLQEVIEKKKQEAKKPVNQTKPPTG